MLTIKAEEKGYENEIAVATKKKELGNALMSNGLTEAKLDCRKKD